MRPTLLVGDYVFVSKFSYGYSRYSLPFGLIPFDGRILSDTPERGDVAVFRNPTETDVDYIKRIVGLPGDRIQMRDGILHINGEPVSRRRVEDFVGPRGRNARQYVETLPGGREHRIIETRGDQGFADNTRVFEVPADHYFAMGDNRDGSQDSRFGRVGFIPHDLLIGRAEILFFSVDPSVSLFMPWTWPGGIRYSRLFDDVE